MKRVIIILTILFTVTTCMAQTKREETIYLAGGCFWGTEHFLKNIRGVLATEVGYANGHTPNPTYEEVCSKKTGYAETVKVVYQPSELSLEKLLSLFFLTIDPTSLNKQGNDVGTQYRTGIYYTTKEQKETALQVINNLAKEYSAPIVVEVLPMDKYYSAEEYHQDYLEHHPSGYCHIPRQLFQVAKEANKKEFTENTLYRSPSKDELKKRLNPRQYSVTQENATEPPFQNEYWDEDRKGIYVDITTGEPLFLSSDKFNSGCGWPSFSKPISEAVLTKHTDLTHNMNRIEVRSKNGKAHLGHLFNDGPKASGGLRYCINSASLKFIPLEEMKQKGYGAFLKYLK